SIFCADETKEEDGYNVARALASDETSEVDSKAHSHTASRAKNEVDNLYGLPKNDESAPPSSGNIDNAGGFAEPLADSVNGVESPGAKSPVGEAKFKDQDKPMQETPVQNDPGGGTKPAAKKNLEPIRTRQRSRRISAKKRSRNDDTPSGPASSQLAPPSVKISSQAPARNKSRPSSAGRHSKRAPTPGPRFRKKAATGRSNIQVKTHAQCIMAKLDNGQNIFEGLDEYLRDPEAHGKPPADDPVWDASTRYEEIVDDRLKPAQLRRPSRKQNPASSRQPSRKQQYAPPSVLRTNWVDLSHKGHVSDYHGYGRKYEHFYPLKGKSLADVQAEMAATIANRSSEVEEDPAAEAEIEEEHAAFENATKIMEKYAMEERRQKKKAIQRAARRKRSPEAVDMPVLFSNAKEHPEICNDKECRFCNASPHFAVDELALNADSRFQFYDKDDEEIIECDDGMQESESGGKRKSRTANIEVQKKASLMVMSEMLNTLSFIETYNDGFKEDPARSLEEEGRSSPELSEGAGRDVSASMRRPRKQARNTGGRKEEPIPISTFEPLFEPLTHARLMEKYAAEKAENGFFYALDADSIEDATKKINSILIKPSADVEAFLADEEIAIEEKALARGIRTYSRKADQEKMEKKEFAEKQEQLQRKLEYTTANRKKKQSPEQMEYAIFSSRSLCFAKSNRRAAASHEACPAGESCLICAPVLHGELPYEQSKIFNPSFQKVDEDTFLQERESHDDATEDAEKSKTNRRAGRAGQRTASKLKLSEMNHTFHFMSAYNSGMIQEEKK
ncbi:MAG: hypothetical protein SGILL_006932, partial [Bacillariaceae sp.]